MNANGIYEWTAIGRPLDPTYATNRAVLLLTPLSGLAVAVVRAFENGLHMSLLEVFLTAAGAAVGGWALARELAPDQPLVAFASLGCSLVVVNFVPEASLLLLFVTVLLTRIANRTVGLPALVSDSIAVSVLVAWTMYTTGLFALGIAAGAAFIMDSMISPQLRRHRILGLMWLVLSIALLLNLRIPLRDFDLEPNSMTWILIGLVCLFLLRMYSTRPPNSRGDATGEILSLWRVRAGMAVALLIVLPSLLLTAPTMRQSALVWATLVGVSFSIRREVVRPPRVEVTPRH